MYTSGTTGRPKGAVLSHFNLLINTYNVVVSLGITASDESFLCGLPLFHIGGLNLISPQLLLGGTSVILPTSYKKPSRVVLVEELPRNASGKVLKFQLREAYAREAAAAGA